MKPFEIHSDHDHETWLRLWDSKIVEFTSKNKGAYSGERCFFGTHEKNQLILLPVPSGSIVPIKRVDR